jgi:hypothetical protein
MRVWVRVRGCGFGSGFGYVGLGSGSGMWDEKRLRDSKGRVRRKSSRQRSRHPRDAPPPMRVCLLGWVRSRVQVGFKVSDYVYEVKIKCRRET